MQLSNLQEVIQYLAKQEQEKQAQKITDAQERLLTVSYDKAAAYTTVIVFGGYAGIFGIWQLAKEYLSKDQTLWAALLVLMSLAAFVLFEVVKMVLVTRQVTSKLAVLRNPSIARDPQLLLQALTEAEKAQQASLRGLLVYWTITTTVAVIGAIGGASILGYAFICGLAK